MTTTIEHHRTTSVFSRMVVTTSVCQELLDESPGTKNGSPFEVRKHVFLQGYRTHTWGIVGQWPERDGKYIVVPYKNECYPVISFDCWIDAGPSFIHVYPC